MSDPTLLEKLRDLAVEKSPEAIKDLVSQGLELARARLSGEELDLVEAGLLRIGSQAEAVAHLGAEGLISVLTLWAVGNPDEAALEFLKEGATFEERRAFMHASTAAAMDAGVDRASSWVRVEEALLAAGRGIAALIPILLAAA